MRKLTPKDIQYYKGATKDFVVDTTVDDKVDTKITNMALNDIEKGNKVKTAKDFDNKADYNWYKSVIYETILRAEYGIEG